VPKSFGTALFAVHWCTWLEINARIFRGGFFNLIRDWVYVYCLASLWCSAKGLFRGLTCLPWIFREINMFCCMICDIFFFGLIFLLWPLLSIFPLRISYPLILCLALKFFVYIRKKVNTWYCQMSLIKCITTYGCTFHYLASCC